MTHPKVKVFIIIVIVLLLGAGLLILTKKSGVPSQTVVTDYKNATYNIGGSDVTLVGGKAESDIAPGSASKLITMYFGNEVRGDFNGDGLEDVAFVLTQSNGGSGTFYYVVVALQTTNGGYQGTNAILLGDRIAPQTTTWSNGQIVVNYADRNPGEPMTTPPSLAVSKYLTISGSQLVEVTPPNNGDPAAHLDLIRVDAPNSGATITSPLNVTGQARGSWFFEASFPVVLLDGNGAQIANSPAHTNNNWMTTEFIPFTVSLSFTKPTTTTGTLMLKKDNPSGLPDKDDFISIPVKF